jgi:chromosome partitioning protein
VTYVIAITNEKGGVAKTTTTLSLGAGLVEFGNRVLLMDLDPQANLTLALGVEPGFAAVTSSHILI